MASCRTHATTNATNHLCWSVQSVEELYSHRTQNSKHAPSVRICEICGRTSSACLFCRRVDPTQPKQFSHRFHSNLLAVIFSHRFHRSAQNLLAVTSVGVSSQQNTLKCNKNKLFLKKLVETFGGFAKKPYLCTRFKELSNTLKQPIQYIGRLAQLV